MCHHVLCLSPNAPPLYFLRPHKFSPHSSSSSHSPLSLSLWYTALLSVTLLRHTAKPIAFIILNFLSIFSCPVNTIVWTSMQNPSPVKLEFLQKWMKGIGKCTSLKKNMSLWERKKAIKVSADLAMASTRNESTCWSRALIANIASRDHNSKVLTEHIIGSSESHRLRKVFASSSSSLLRNKRRILDRSRKILKRRRRTIQSRVKKIVMADSIARRLVQKRTEMLKRLVPGGDLMDDMSLIEETLDYIQSLRSQVQVMRCLLTTSQFMKC